MDQGENSTTNRSKYRYPVGTHIPCPLPCGRKVPSEKWNGPMADRSELRPENGQALLERPRRIIQVTARLVEDEAGAGRTLGGLSQGVALHRGDHAGVQLEEGT